MSMRIPTALILLLLVTIGCGTRETTQQDASDSLSNPITEEQDGTRGEASEGQQTTNLDSTVFISYAHPLHETKQFYVSAYFRDGVNYSKARLTTDSIIMDEDGYSRKRLSKSTHEYFQLESLDTLLFFNAAHQFLGKSTLIRIEEIEDVIESEIVAVYGVPDDVILGDGPYYCISSNFKGEQQDGFHYEEFHDALLDKQILAIVGDTSRYVKMHHVKVASTEKTYSTVASPTHCYIIETAGNKSTVLYQGEDDYRFAEPLPLPISSHGKPLLLLTWYIPETDAVGNLLAVYNEEGYEPVHDGRVKQSLVKP